MSRYVFCCIILACALPLAAQEPNPNDCLIMVGLVWPDHDLSTAQVRVFRDARRQDLVEAFPAVDATGKVLLTLAPGTYYLTALVDLNNNGKLDAGDGLGFHGVMDPNTDQPQPLEVKAKLSALRIPISLVMREDGKLAPTSVKLAAPETPPPVKECRVAGTVSGGSPGKAQVVLLVAKSPRGPSYAALPAAEGGFSVTVLAGEYYIFAAEDTNGTEGLGPGDLFAVHGYGAEMGHDFPTVKVEQDTADIPLTLQWRVSDTGLLKSLDDTVEGPQVALQTLPAVLIGSIANVPEGSKAIVSACTDSRFGGEVDTASTSDGRFVLSLGAGVYFLNVMSVRNPDGVTRAAGDLVGFYGVSDLRLAHGPQPVALRPGELRVVEIRLVARLDEQMRPVAIE